MKRSFWLLVAVTCLSPCIRGEDAATAPAGAPARAASAPASRPAPGMVSFKHLRLDLSARNVTLDAEVCLRSGALEFLVCKTGTKDYESILRTPAEASRLHAALLALGLTPGKPARWVDNPEGDSGKFLPPQGPALKITLVWKDPQGKTQQADAGTWLAIAGQRKAPKPEKWIFVGSQVLPDGRYWADMEGEVVSVANFASSVIDVPFESSNKNALLDYVANTDAIPPVGTNVEMVITPDADAARSPHARALLEIDALGRLRMDERPILAFDLSEWARRFIAAHAKGQVQIRADGRALVYDVDQAKEELRLGGVFDVEITRLPPEGMVLPRTPQQAKQQLDWWAKQFANARELITDPAEDAQAVLEQIRREIEQLKATQAMWAEYAAHLRQAMEHYKASTQPSGRPNPDESKPGGAAPAPTPAPEE